ncbi:BlaI family transcriptional regulator [Anaerosphaera sp. HMSC064C01]|nr:BlaI family transcriptional regulator [Anaerosphaera sp. HMSC064C01]
MNLSDSELIVLEELWKGDCLDENGEITALELSKILNEKYNFSKSSSYTFINRLVEKNALNRRYPNYKIKPVIKREDLGNNQIQKIIDTVYKGSFVKLFSAFVNNNKITNTELEEMKNIISSIEIKDE